MTIQGIYILIGLVAAVLLLLGIRERNKREMPPDMPVEVVSLIRQLWTRCPEYLLRLDKFVQEYNRMAKHEVDLLDEREERIRSNAEYEKRPADGFCTGDRFNITLEGFKLYSLLTHPYKGERSLAMNKRIQFICDRIVAGLDSGEIDMLMQINRKVTDEAEDTLLGVDKDIAEGMSILQDMCRKDGYAGERDNP